MDIDNLFSSVTVKSNLLAQTKHFWQGKKEINAKLLWNKKT